MKLERLPSGSYRIKKTINGKVYRKTFDHKPTQTEITLSLAEFIGQSDTPVNSGTFRMCLESYIRSKSNILSPSTIVYYKQSSRVFPDWFMDKDISEITQIDVQNVINDYAKDHAPKTVRNINGVISAVMRMYRPSLSLNTSLPLAKPYEPNLPTHEDIVRILKAAKGTEYHIAFQLGILGLRRGEIIALDLTDLDGDVLTIDKSKALSVDGSYQVKNTPKTVSSVRQIVLPDKLAKEIRKTGYIFRGYPNTICKNLHRIQDSLGIPRCRFHDLRHYFVSYAHSIGMSDADIISLTGHKTDFVMKRVYRHSLADKKQKKKLANSILS